MKRIIFLAVLVLSLFVFSSCGGNSKAKLIGTWKVSDVQTDFNEGQVTPEMLAQVVEMQKQTHFRFVNDSTMIIISNNNTHEANWVFNEDDQTIAFFFEGMETQPNILGTLDNNTIVTESKTPLGVITTIFSKE
jgi:hypothetical protein